MANILNRIFLKSTFLLLSIGSIQVSAQNIGNFISLEPLSQSSDFIIPTTHVFQKIIEESEGLTQGGLLPGNNDFTGYVPINGNSENGYLSINSELTPGGVSILDINFNETTKLWETTLSQAVSFVNVAGTARNCSGTVTPWNTIISCEESISSSDTNNDDRNDLGWCVEINPATKTVIDKRSIDFHSISCYILRINHTKITNSSHFYHNRLFFFVFHAQHKKAQAQIWTCASICFLKRTDYRFAIAIT